MQNDAADAREKMQEHRDCDEIAISFLKQRWWTADLEAKEHRGVERVLIQRSLLTEVTLLQMRYLVEVYSDCDHYLVGTFAQNLYGCCPLVTYTSATRTVWQLDAGAGHVASRY